MSYFSLLEDFRYMGMLFEGIDDMRKFYKNIPENEFISYVELDPTYKQGSNKAGTYAKWILGLANSNNLKDKNHIKDLLSRFEENKKNLKDKDIMKFKSMDELESYLNDDDNYNELSHRQEVRQRQKDRRNVDLNNEAELVYEDDDWEVWVPETYAASCKLGQGTSWCTASTETSDYFDRYNDEGSLFININKHNPEEKYQFHFDSESYMDKNDEEIDLDYFFANNESLYKNYYIQYLELDIDFEDVKEQVEILKQNGGTLVYKGQQIPNPIRGFITNIVIHNSVTRIDPYAFYKCTRLTSIEIPNNVTSIGGQAFYGCRSLTEIIIPDSVTSIGNSAFIYCSKLERVVIGNGVTNIGDDAFYNCDKLTSVVIGDNVTSIGESAFAYCDSLTSVIIGGSVTNIGNSAFRSCNGLTSVTIPNSVTSIGYYAFAFCSNLTSVVIPDSVTSICGVAFSECSNLNEIKYTGSANQWKQIKKGENWAKGVPAKSIKLVDSVGIDENFKRRNKHIQ